MEHGGELPEGSRLRLAAEGQLRERTAPPTRGWPVGTDTLALLHKLASQPESASDALKLLHELQVHQVELDLLYSELEEREIVMQRELRRYQNAFEWVPAAYFLVSGAGIIEEASRTGGGLFDLDAAALAGQPLASFLPEAGRRALGDLLQALRPGEAAVDSESDPVAIRPGLALRVRGAAGPAAGDPCMIVIS
jgi:PAS domain-containing protein